MILIVGLGNPGDRHAANRHNIGFMAVDRIAVDHGFGPWRSRFQGLVADGHLGPARVTLLKPQTFMNLSGQSVGEAMRFLKLTPADVVVLHDEIDLAPAKLKVKTGGGHAGHNGLRSIDAHIGGDFHRVRLGVGHPGHKDAVPGYVLRDFPKADATWLDDLMRGIEDGAPALAARDWATFQNRVALRLTPPRTSRPGRSVSDPDDEADTPPAPPVRSVPRSAQRPPVRPAPDPAAEPGDDPDARTALRRLADRFR